jgi:hypothetical protein
MYDGAQTSGNEVFKIHKVDNKYQAWLKGHIEAESGYLGDWEIIDGKLSTEVKSSTYWDASKLTIGTNGIYFQNDNC